MADAFHNGVLDRKWVPDAANPYAAPEERADWWAGWQKEEIRQHDAWLDRQAKLIEEKAA